jgi:hypothetical protein
LAGGVGGVLACCEITGVGLGTLELTLEMAMGQSFVAPEPDRWTPTPHEADP